jgi:tetratricopeptide (TPR) repeat protein
MQVIYDVLGKSDLAKDKLQNILKFYENDLAVAYDRLAYAYFKVDILNEAEHFCREALTINPGVAAFHYNLGMIQFKKNELIKSKTEFIKVLDLANDRNEKDKRFNLYAIRKIERINNILGREVG